MKGRECVKLAEIREISHLARLPLSPLFFLHFKKLCPSPFTPSLLSPQSTPRSSLIPSPPLSPSVSPTLLSLPARPLLCVCGPEGWIRMSDRKRSHFLTSLFPLPFAHFLELHFVLYPCNNLSAFSCRDWNFAHDTRTLWPWSLRSEGFSWPRSVYILLSKQWGIVFTAFSIQGEGVGRIKSILSCTQLEAIGLDRGACAPVSAGLRSGQQKQQKQCFWIWGGRAGIPSEGYV